MIERRIKCACGDEFVSSSPRAFMCPVCRKVKFKIYNKHFQKTRNKVISKVLAEREFEKYLKKPKTDLTATPKPLHHCPYCGRMTTNEFCRQCQYDGFDAVYDLTGRSNGWNRKKPEFFKVESGWRGQMVAGGSAAERRRHE